MPTTSCPGLDLPTAQYFVVEPNEPSRGGIQTTMKVKDVMTTKVITVREEQTRQQAARLLSQHRISGLPVVKDDNLLVGVVTEYDVIAREGKTVGDIMTRGVISVAADTDLEEASHILVHEL